MPSKSKSKKSTRPVEAKKEEPVPPPVVKLSKFRDNKNNLLVRNLFHFYLQKRITANTSGPQLSNMCVEIKNIMDSRIGPSWQCIIAPDPDIVIRYHLREGVIVCVENHPGKAPAEQMVFIAFRGSRADPTPPTDVDHAENFDDSVKRSMKRRIKLLSTNMKHSKVQGCLEQLAICAEEFPRDCQGMMLQLRARLNVLHGVMWHACATEKRLGFAVGDDAPFFEVDFSPWHITVFQCDQPQPKDTTTCCFGILRRPSMKTWPLYGYVLAAVFFFMYFYGHGQLCGAFPSPADVAPPLSDRDVWDDADGGGGGEEEEGLMAHSEGAGEVQYPPFYCGITEGMWGFMAFGTFIACYLFRMVTRTVTKVRRN